MQSAIHNSSLFNAIVNWVNLGQGKVLHHEIGLQTNARLCIAGFIQVLSFKKDLNEFKCENMIL